MRVVCRCLRVTEEVLLAALTTYEVKTVRDLQRHTGAGDGCMACHALLKRYLEPGAPALPSPICSAG
jgi:NAD(P)H-nitrite reductase large subunit